MTSRTTASALSGLTVTIALAGCVAMPPIAPTPTPTPEHLGTVASINDLVSAFQEAGGECDWERTDRVANASQSGECSSSSVLMMFADRTEREATIAVLRSIAVDDLSLLVGENWMINSPEAADVQGELGGELITS